MVRQATQLCISVNIKEGISGAKHKMIKSTYKSNALKNEGHKILRHEYRTTGQVCRRYEHLYSSFLRFSNLGRASINRDKKKKTDNAVITLFTAFISFYSCQSKSLMQVCPEGSFLLFWNSWQNQRKTLIQYHSVLLSWDTWNTFDSTALPLKRISFQRMSLFIHKVSISLIN